MGMYVKQDSEEVERRDRFLEVAGEPPVWATTGSPPACAYQASIAVPSSGEVNAASQGLKPVPMLNSR